MTATKAFTPKVDGQPEIILETAQGIRRILAPAYNHFKKALQVFDNSIKDVALRETQYDAIARQSASLD